jgi:hypothetical protein
MSPEKRTERLARFMPRGVPRWLRCYDNGGKTFDRHTVVFTGRYGKKTAGDTWVLGMSEHPFHPQGFGQHSTYPNRIDYPNGRHLGKKIAFNDLPADCQRCVLQDYNELWDLKPEKKHDDTLRLK